MDTTHPSPAAFFVDTDMGIDDAVAVAWLLRQHTAHVVGFSTVFGNSTVENVTANLLTLLDAAECNLPLTMGAAEPLVFPRIQTGAFVHGPDGFWSGQRPHYLGALPGDAPTAIAQAVRDNPGLTIIALGPLTNLAQAVQRYPTDLANIRLVALGGAKYGGNVTPVAEFNIYADPHALEVVLAGGMRVELVTLDAFQQVQVDPVTFIPKLETRGGTVGQLLARILPPFAQAFTLGAGGPIALPDVAAVIYALRGDLGTSVSSLVRVITDSGDTRGLTIIADTPARKIPLLADSAELSAIAQQVFAPGFDLQATLFAILQRQPDNALVVADAAGAQMALLLEQTLTNLV